MSDNQNTLRCGDLLCTEDGASAYCQFDREALVNLETRCTGEGGRLICSGDALVLFQC